MNTKKLALCATAVLAAVALLALEISQAVGDGAVDRHVVRDRVHTVVVDAQGGDVRLAPSVRGVQVHVKRHHVINTPTTSERIEDGVLTLRTSCALGLLSCRSDYRLGIPPRVAVKVRKSSGTVDAARLGGGVVDLDRVATPRTVTLRSGSLRVEARD